MAGVKGRSGRRTTSIEDKRKATIDRAWQVCAEILNDSTAPLSLRADIAKTIVSKNMPQELVHSGSITWESLFNDLSGAEARNTRQVQSISNN